jgi:hypothetical protein
MSPGQVLLVPGKFGGIQEVVGALNHALDVGVERKHGARQTADADTDDALDGKSRAQDLLDRAEVRNASRATAS